MNDNLEYLSKLAKKSEKKSGHLSPGTTAMLGALLGPTGAAAGAEIGRRGRATEGSPALRAGAGSIAGSIGGAALGGLSVAAILKAKGLPSKLRESVLKRKLKSAKGLGAKLDAAHKLGKHRSKASTTKTPLEKAKQRDDDSLKTLVGAGAGSLAGYFEGARRGAKSVKYKEDK